VGIELLARSVLGGYVAGVDPSDEMVEQARARNVKAVESSRVDLRYGCVERLPFEDHTVTNALAMNAMHAWPDTVAGLRDMRRVMTPGGRMALGFTSYSWQSKDGLPAMLTAAGLTEAHVVEAEAGFCALAITPSSTMMGECHLTGGWSGPAWKRSAMIPVLVAASRSTAGRETDC